MATRLRHGVTAIVAAAALAAAVPALGADQGAGARFDVTVNLVANVIGFGACGVQIHATGDATGTHVGGNGAWVDDECVNFFGQLTGDGTLTATNGDEIFIHYQATTPPPDPAIH